MIIDLSKEECLFLRESMQTAADEGYPRYSNGDKLALIIDSVWEKLERAEKTA